jgi:hypothetical protein
MLLLHVITQKVLSLTFVLLKAFVLFATKATTCYAGGKGKALARKEVTK